jgi:hypothetical protein
MKKRIVLWGNDANDEKILVGVELIDEDNKVKIYTYDEKAATEEVYQTMMEKWRSGNEMILPEGFKEQERALSMSEDLLPEDIKVERTDIIARAKAEWHFIVLSSKLYQMYSSELEDFKDKVEELSDYSSEVWDDMSTFWTKVQEQVREKNLFREHAAELREGTNNIFEKLKELRKSFQNEFKQQSREKANVIKAELDAIEQKIEKGLGLKPIFNELKDIQAKFKGEKFANDDQRKLWNQIDRLFKVVKEKRFGDQASSGGAASRLEKRYSGLMNAINKMQRSINRDKQDLDWEHKRIDQTDGQLEMQIRQAKIKMIEERVSSKNVKLEDMLKTKVDLESKIEMEKQREVKRAEAAKAKEVQKEIKEKIAEEIKEKQKELAADAPKLEQLASDIVGAKKTKKAAPLVEEESTKQEMPKEAKSKKEDPIQEAPKETKEEESLLDVATEEIGSSLSHVVDSVKAVAGIVEERIEDQVKDIKDKVTSFKEDHAEGAVEEMKENVENMVDSAMKAIKNIVEKVEDKVEDLVDELTDEEE